MGVGGPLPLLQGGGMKDCWHFANNNLKNTPCYCLTPSAMSLGGYWPLFCNLIAQYDRGTFRIEIVLRDVRHLLRLPARSPPCAPHRAGNRLRRQMRPPANYAARKMRSDPFEKCRERKMVPAPPGFPPGGGVRGLFPEHEEPAAIPGTANTVRHAGDAGRSDGRGGGYPVRRGGRWPSSGR